MAVWCACLCIRENVDVNFIFAVSEEGEGVGKRMDVTESERESERESHSSDVWLQCEDHCTSDDNNSDITATLWLKWSTDLSSVVAFCTVH